MTASCQLPIAYCPLTSMRSAGARLDVAAPALAALAAHLLAGGLGVAAPGRPVLPGGEIGPRLDRLLLGLRARRPVAAAAVEVVGEAGLAPDLDPAVNAGNPRLLGLRRRACADEDAQRQCAADHPYASHCPMILVI